jgi:chromosome segregation ATPase
VFLHRNSSLNKQRLNKIPLERYLFDPLVLKTISLLIALTCCACGNGTDHAPIPPTAITPATPELNRGYQQTKGNASHAVLGDDELDDQFSELSHDADDIQIKVSSLRDEVDELISHHGDVDTAESDSDDIVTHTRELLERVEELKSRAGDTNHDDIETKCDSLETSLNKLLLSASELHDTVETAQQDGNYRHHEGVSEMSDSMDDVETHSQEVTSDASE